ncbi:hypothetical protein [Porphyromonas somerae]|uniref:hypothetical protein n=1 Tax=Porphyromonas somerae TaxID=322095 RepID=UPI0003771D38|nr:hypothetical protein [Porphyromonas somerae]
MRKSNRKIVIIGVILSALFFSLVHFRRDILKAPVDYYLLRTDTTGVGPRGRWQIVLTKNAPYMENNIQRCLEDYFWNVVTQDTLDLYEYYSLIYYRETKYLTQNFKEGDQYAPLFSHWDNTMDWRNHYKDKLGKIVFWKREDGTGFYIVEIKSSGLGFKILVDTFKEKRTFESFDSYKEFYIRKRKALGIEKK